MPKKKVASLSNEIISLHRVQHARSFHSRFMGLMGVAPGFDYALVFHLEKKGVLEASIHMLFMRTPIDVLWLDERKRVVDWKLHVTPWTLNASPRASAAYIVELPPHTLEGIRLKRAQKVEWDGE
ncbi:MAG: DUF192 domain-containing protein [archaeon]